MTNVPDCRIFTWNILVTSILVLAGLPAADRRPVRLAPPPPRRAHLRPRQRPVFCWQHLVLVLRTPEVSSIALPFFFRASSPRILPGVLAQPIFGYTTLIYRHAVDRRAVRRVWAHHMYATGAVLLPFSRHDVPDRGANRHQVLSTGSARCGKGQ